MIKIILICKPQDIIIKQFFYKDSDENNWLIVIGGENNYGEILSSIEIIDLDINSGEPLKAQSFQDAELNRERTDFGVVVNQETDGDWLYIFGGRSGEKSGTNPIPARNDIEKIKITDLLPTTPPEPEPGRGL